MKKNKPSVPNDLTEFRKFCQDLQKMEQRAIDLNLWVTKRVINCAGVAAGYELSGDVVVAAKMARERVE